MLTVKKLARMQNRIEFIIGYRNLVNMAVIFVAIVVCVFASQTPEGIIIGSVFVVLGFKWFHTQMIRNIDDLECQDVLANKE